MKKRKMNFQNYIKERQIRLEVTKLLSKNKALRTTFKEFIKELSGIK